MRTYYLKIRDKFIDLVKSGVKKHEYRLGEPERLDVKIGDTLVLLSNTNKKSYVRTTVTNIIKYDNWQDALEKNWENDFKDLYKSFDEAVHDCYKFYTKEEVEKYGIIVFSIIPLKIDYLKSSVLLDTNIIIKRESSNNVSYDVSRLFNWMDKNSIKKYIHKLTIQEIENYLDEDIRKVMLTKIKSYDVLPTLKTISDDKFNTVVSYFSLDSNSQIDNELLKEVYNDNVGVLITDDISMIKKAQLLYIRDRVLTSSEFLKYFEDLFPANIEYTMLNVKLTKFADVDLDDVFFDTLREDYEGKKFNDWFKKKALSDESAYVFKDETGLLQGFLYLKVEKPDEPDYKKVTPNLSAKLRLKIGTFKINSSGFRLGERFLKIIFDNALDKKVKEIYVTMFEDKRDEVKRLKTLLEDWGFKKFGVKGNGEIVLIKTLETYDDTKNPKFNYPIVKKNIQSSFLPIKAQFHTDLFPDNILKNEDMHLYADNLAHRYALEKIYITRYNDKRGELKPGDLMFVYRMAEDYEIKGYRSVVSGLVIIEDIIMASSEEELLKECSNRSIFDEATLKLLYKENIRTILKLLDYKTFNHKITLDELRENDIVGKKEGPRLTTALTIDKCKLIYKLGEEDKNGEE